MSGVIDDGYGDNPLVPAHLNEADRRLVAEWLAERQREKEAAAKAAAEADEKARDQLAIAEGRLAGLNDYADKLEALEMEAQRLERERELRAFYSSAHFVESAGTPAGDMTPYAAAVSEIQPHHTGRDVEMIFKKWGV